MKDQKKKEIKIRLRAWAAFLIEEIISSPNFPAQTKVDAIADALLWFERCYREGLSIPLSTFIGETIPGVLPIVPTPLLTEIKREVGREVVVATIPARWRDYVLLICERTGLSANDFIHSVLSVYNLAHGLVGVTDLSAKHSVRSKESGVVLLDSTSQESIYRTRANAQQISQCTDALPERLYSPQMPETFDFDPLSVEFYDEE